MISFQRRLEELRWTFKPANTHVTVAHSTSQDGPLIAIMLADAIANKTYDITFEAWGPHSVALEGPLKDCLVEKIDDVERQGLAVRRSDRRFHVELIPKLRDDETYYGVARGASDVLWSSGARGTLLR